MPDDPKAPGAVQTSDLPPTLCHHCKFGTVITEASAFHEDDDGEFWLKQYKAVSREVAFCRNPTIAGNGNDPAEMPHVVIHCSGFRQKPIEVMEPIGEVKVPSKRVRQRKRLVHLRRRRRRRNR